MVRDVWMKMEYLKIIVIQFVTVLAMQKTVPANVVVMIL
jgi:hypothetical protein